jgi:hypothetical protein
LKKKLDAVKPTRANNKRTYGQPLRVLERGADRNREGHWSKVHRGSEATELFYSIRWDEAWQQFLQRKSDGKFKYKTARDLAHALAVGVDAKTRRRRARYLYSAIGPASAADKKKQVPYLGDWEMLRAQTFLGEVKDDQVLFGTPQMKVIKEATRKMKDLTEIAQAHAAMLMPFLGRYDAWCRQIDRAYNYSILNEKGEYDERRARPYVEFINNMRDALISTIEASLRCYGIGKDDASVLMQIFVARMRDELGDAMPIISRRTFGRSADNRRQGGRRWRAAGRRRGEARGEPDDEAHHAVVPREVDPVQDAAPGCTHRRRARRGGAG